MSEIELLSTPQHKVKYIFRLPRWIVGAVVASGAMYFLTDTSWWGGLIVSLLVLALGLWLEWLRFKKSRLVVTNLRVYLSVLKGMTSGFEAGLHYRQIKNCAFRKEHLIHTLTGSGTLYLRAGGDEKEQIAAEYVPDVERVCRVINGLLALSEEKRSVMQSLDEKAA